MSTPLAQPREEEPPVVQLRLCPTCGAVCEVSQNKCWLCMTDGPPVNPYAVEARVVTAELASNAQFDLFFTILLIGCFLTALLLAVGIGAQDPGLLIVYLILVAPAFLITGLKALHQTATGGVARPKKLFLSLVISFSITIAVIALLIFASIVLLFVICIGAIARQ